MRRLAPALAAAVLAASVPACGLPMGPYKAEAHDTWRHTYTIGKNGDVRISNINGRVDVEGTDGSTVEVEAERIAHAATDQLAKDLLPKIPINDRSTADTVFVETGRISGILIGASFEVQYKVRVPKAVRVRATTVNGVVRAEKISGPLEARTVNGIVRAQFDALVPGDNILGVINGRVRISLPDTAKATVNATWVNGGINTPGLKFDVRDSGKRRFEGLLNGGGASLRASTVNGNIVITAAGQKDNGDEAGDVVGDVVEKRLKARGVQ
jgi:DUF4097 and DUF4098 domain-containing protein YvlB